MSEIAIHAEGLGKLYRIAGRERHDSLRAAIVGGALAWLGRLGVGRIGGRSSDAREFWALRDASFDIMRGEVVGVVGRNGAGKSTLLKILGRITEPTEGRAELHGRIGSLLEVGTGFHSDLTGRENIYLNGAILGMRKREIERKFDEIVAFSELEEFIDTPVKRYSNGMYVRLAFGVAAHLEPEILLVDEVLAVGDVRFQRKCLGKMDEVARSGRTILFISHQLNQIRRLCGRAMWLDRGVVRAFGPTVDVVSAYEAENSLRSGLTPGAGVPRQAGTRFLGWDIVEPRSSNPAVLATMGPVRVRFVLQVDDAIRNGLVGIGLYDVEGRLLWGTGTTNLRIDPGIHEILYDLDALPLAPGTYSWRVAIFSDGSRLTDEWQCVPDLVVGTEPLGHFRDEYAGFLNIPWKLTIQPSPAPSGRTEDW